MPFLRCTEGRGYTMRVTEIVTQYVDVPSSSLVAASLNLVPFDKRFDLLHVYSQFD